MAGRAQTPIPGPGRRPVRGRLIIVPKATSSAPWPGALARRPADFSCRATIALVRGASESNARIAAHPRGSPAIGRRAWRRRGVRRPRRGRSAAVAAGRRRGGGRRGRRRGRRPRSARRPTSQRPRPRSAAAAAPRVASAAAQQFGEAARDAPRSTRAQAGARRRASCRCVASVMPLGERARLALLPLAA